MTPDRTTLHGSLDIFDSLSSQMAQADRLIASSSLHEPVSLSLLPRRAGRVQAGERLLRHAELPVMSAAYHQPATLCAAALLSSMGSTEEEEYHPSQGHQTQPHHPAKEELWERMRSEAWSNAVGYGERLAALDI